MRLEGMYSTIEKAEEGIERLLHQGFSADDVTIVMSQETRDRLNAGLDANIAINNPSVDNSVWGRVKQRFTGDEVYKRLVDETDVKVPKSDAKYIRRGKIAVFLNSNAKKMDPFDPDSQERFN